MGLSIDATTAEHIGDRGSMQDRVAIVPSAKLRGTAMVILADGAGGYTGGEAAADQVLATARSDEAHTIIKLNRILTEEEPHATIVAMILQPDRVDWAHVGDSRLYHFRHGDLRHRTPDHSLVEQLVREGQLGEAERHTHPNRNLLIQALGHSEQPKPDFGATAPLADGDAFLLCSDGLWDYFEDAAIGKALNALPPRKAAELLITAARAKAKGRGDNISLAIVKLGAT